MSKDDHLALTDISIITAAKEIAEINQVIESVNNLNIFSTEKTRFIKNLELEKLKIATTLEKRIKYHIGKLVKEND